MEPKNHQEQQKQLADISTCLQSYSFKINTGKSQGNESVLVSWIREKASSLESDQKYSKQIVEEAVAEKEVILIQNKKYNTKQYNIGKYNTENTTHM